jgi:hypothetical protein
MIFGRDRCWLYRDADPSEVSSTIRPLTSLRPRRRIASAASSSGITRSIRDLRRLLRPSPSPCPPRLLHPRKLLDPSAYDFRKGLRRNLASYAAYNNRVCIHLALNKNKPLGRAVQRSGSIISIPKLGGLHHQYVRI